MQRFQAWLQEQLAAAPLADDHAMLAWWPGFKAEVAKQVHVLDGEHKRSLTAVSEAQAGAERDISALYRQLDTGRPPEAVMP